MDIRLESIEGQQREVLVGLSGDTSQLDQEIVDAVRANGRLFPHVIYHIAGNLALEGGDLISKMTQVRNQLIEALSREETS
jgi:hypothetical protein